MIRFIFYGCLVSMLVWFSAYQLWSETQIYSLSLAIAIFYAVLIFSGPGNITRIVLVALLILHLGVVWTAFLNRLELIRLLDQVKIVSQNDGIQSQ